MSRELGLFVDPSTASTGWCVAGAGPDVRDAGRIAPKGDYVDRTDNICAELGRLVWVWEPAFVQVERLSGAHSAIAKYGYAVGAIRGYLRGHFPKVRHELPRAISLSKASRHRKALKAWPALAEIHDPKLDVSDAVAMAVLYWQMAGVKS